MTEGCAARAGCQDVMEGRGWDKRREDVMGEEERGYSGMVWGSVGLCDGVAR